MIWKDDSMMEVVRSKQSKKEGNKPRRETRKPTGDMLTPIGKTNMGEVDKEMF